MTECAGVVVGSTEIYIEASVFVLRQFHSMFTILFQSFIITNFYLQISHTNYSIFFLFWAIVIHVYPNLFPSLITDLSTYFIYCFSLSKSHNSKFIPLLSTQPYLSLSLSLPPSLPLFLSLPPPPPPASPLLLLLTPPFYVRTVWALSLTTTLTGAPSQ